MHLHMVEEAEYAEELQKSKGCDDDRSEIGKTGGMQWRQKLDR